MHSIKMKGLLYITAALTILLCVGTANAEGVGVATISADGLRLRAEPNTEAKVLTTASNGSRAIVLGDAQDGWYPVSYHAEEGYMSAEYLDVVYETEADLGSGLVKTSGSTLNIRSGPGTDYERVTAVRNGAVVKLTGIKDGWFKVEYNGAQGYMLSGAQRPRVFRGRLCRGPGDSHLCRPVPGRALCLRRQWSQQL